MHQHDPDSFALREPTAKKIRRFPIYPIGIHEKWCGDGHDKLYKIGFPIWGVADFGSNKNLGAWVVPSNRLAEIVAYCFLCLVEEYEGEFRVRFTVLCITTKTALRDSTSIYD